MRAPLQALLFVVKSTCTRPRRDEGQKCPLVTESHEVGPSFATSRPVRDSCEANGDSMLIDLITYTVA